MQGRDRYKEKLDSLLDNWNADFDKLEAKLRNAGADPTADYDDVITALRRHRCTPNDNRDGIHSRS